MTKPARVALRGRLKEMMLLTGGQASADSSTAGQRGSIGAVQAGDRAHGGGAVQGRAAGERPAAGERERERERPAAGERERERGAFMQSVGLCLYTLFIPSCPMLRNVLDILVCFILN